MTLTELRYIVAVARERHFGHAAEACHVSQPTLSVAVKKLEDELGTILFERGKHDVSMTPVGERIVQQAQKVLEEAEEIYHIAQHTHSQLEGPLRLGAIYTIGPYLLPHLIPLLRERHPLMQLLIEENYTAQLTYALKQGELDVIILSLPFEEPGLLTLAVYDEPFVAVLPAEHPWVGRSHLSLDDVASETLLMLGDGHCFRDQVLQWCPQCRRPTTSSNDIERSVQGSSLETIRHMVASGLGITILPCTATTHELYTQRLLATCPLAPPVPKRRVALAWRSSFPRPKAIEALRMAILSCELPCVEPLHR